VQFWDTGTGKEVRRLSGPWAPLLGHTGAVQCLALSPDGTQLLSGAGNADGSDCTVRLWDLRKHQQLKCFEGHPATVTGVAFAPGGKRAVSVSVDGTVRLWDLEAPLAEAGRELGKRWRPRAVSFLGDEQIITTGDYRHLTVWGRDGKIVSEPRLPYLVAALALSKDGKYLAKANSNGTVNVLPLPLQRR
jgi:WD40 repeat protein